MAADYLNYVLSNPDLRENAEAAGLTNAEMAEWGEIHYENHGKNEGRQNTPTAITNVEGYTQTLGAEHYQGRDVQEVLQASVRAGDPSEMWEAREDIRPEWNLGQYTAEGWNLDPDNPYKTGILGDTIEVNPDIGQLVPTTAVGNVGNLNFIQDRYVDESIANDFPVGWTTPENTWAAAAPQQLGAFWDVLTSATRDEAGILGRVDPYDPATAVGPSVSPGTRGGGNIRPDRGGAGYGGPLIGGPATGGPPNPTVPSFGYPQYQDWTRFMPTNFQLAEGGGMHYQPWATGTPQGGGGNFVARPDPVFTTGGGGTTATGGPGPINPNIWGNTDTTSSSNTTTDSSGNRWVMSPGGQWYRADSDYGQGLLGTGRLFYDQHYDSSGNYVGAEGLSQEEQGVNWAADAHEAMYPGSQQMASDAGFGLLTANRFNPAYRDYRQSNINDMVRLGVSNVLPGATTYNSQNWRDLQTARAADWDNPNVGVQPAASVMPNLAAEIEAMMSGTSSGTSGGPNTGPAGRPGY